MPNKKFNSVTDLARHTLDNQELAGQVEERILRSQITKKLLALRAARDLSQTDIANRMQCTQSRISKLESGFDEDMRLGDLAEYLSAMDLQLGVLIRKRGTTLVDEMKFHAASIQRILGQLTETAGNDKEIARGVLQFIVDAVGNLTNLFRTTAIKLLPAIAPKKPGIVIDADELDFPLVETTEIENEAVQTCTAP